MRLKDLTGKRFERWLVEARAGDKWLCVCDCGKRAAVYGQMLRNGRSRSCGCLRSELAAVRLRILIDGRPIHAPTQTSWRKMLERCRDPSDISYPRYGGRGIKVCDRWESLRNFLADMGERTEGMSLDRIDVDGDYEPGNCRWATRQEQNTNKRNTRWVEVDGERVCMKEAARRAGVDYYAFRHQMVRRGKDFLAALKDI